MNILLIILFVLFTVFYIVFLVMPVINEKRGVRPPPLPYESCPNCPGLVEAGAILEELLFEDPFKYLAEAEQLLIYCKGELPLTACGGYKEAALLVKFKHHSTCQGGTALRKEDIVQYPNIIKYLGLDTKAEG